MGKEKVHFEAPAAALLEDEMSKFLSWFNERQRSTPVLKAGCTFLVCNYSSVEDGNGRMHVRSPIWPGGEPLRPKSLLQHVVAD